MRGIFTFDFWKDKYGPELLIDVMTLAEMPGYVDHGVTHRLLYYEILFVEQGAGTVQIDDQESPIQPNTILFTDQGSVRSWRVTEPMQATALFFTPEFLTQTLADARFIDDLSIYASGPKHLDITSEQLSGFLSDLKTMKAELPHLRADTDKVLQADLHRLLVRLNRLYEAAYGQKTQTRTSEHIGRFRRAIEENFLQRMSVAGYANQLGITPGHLNDLCVERCGVTASEMIQRRALVEARRLLAHSDLGVSEIGRRLGFVDPSHFGRYFRSRLGMSPASWRRKNHRAAEGP